MLHVSPIKYPFIIYSNYTQDYHNASFKAGLQINSCQIQIVKIGAHHMDLIAQREGKAD